MYKIVYEKQAIKDIQNLKSAKLDSKAKELIEIVRKYPFQNPPPYEALVGNLSGLFSRRLNIQHRFVYQVYVGKMVEDSIEYEGTVKIIRMWSHYENLKKHITPASTLTFVLSRRLLERSLLTQLPFYATFAPTLPYASRRQRHKCRLSECYAHTL